MAKQEYDRISTDDSASFKLLPANSNTGIVTVSPIKPATKNAKILPKTTSAILNATASNQVLFNVLYTMPLESQTPYSKDINIGARTDKISLLTSTANIHLQLEHIDL